MMKKNGFTLAEVLITLAIIGVIATLTLPSLISNTAEQQAIAGFRKAMNTLNEAGQMNVAINGFDYSQLTENTTYKAGQAYKDDTTDLPYKSLWSILKVNTQVDQGGDGLVGGECSDLDVVLFRDGTAVCYESKNTGGANDTIEGWIDTNGVKNPNAASECGDSNCATASRNINDQFAITFKGTNVIPGHFESADEETEETVAAREAITNAAAWAMRK
jgi:prepilin-type N-terminal cleavage/methylation domain-containing protein